MLQQGDARIPGGGLRGDLRAVPLDSNVEDVAATRYYLNQVSSPAILIGHSYGGAVITGAGIDDRVVGLVYIAAVAPDADETTASLIAKFPETALFRHVKVADGRVWMPHDATADFCGDLPEAEQQIVWATAAPPSTELLGTKTAGVAWQTKPSWYIVANNDNAVNPELERFCANRMNATIYDMVPSHLGILRCHRSR